MASLIDLFKGSSYDEVNTDTETFLEEETDGLRVMSAAELNNPLLYGNEAIRIATKSTPSINTMKEATQGELATGGLLGKGLSLLSGGKITSLNDARNTINDFLGIPDPLIPTRVAGKLEGGKTVQEVLDEKNGTELGKFLKQTGGGTPNTIANQALGNVITIAKNKATKFLLGTPGEIGQNLPLPTSEGTQPPDFVGEYDGTTYTEYSKEVYTELDGQDIRTAGELNQQYATRFPNIDLAYHSPIYGVQRGSKLDKSDLGFQTKKNSSYDSNVKGLSNYDPLRTYTETAEGDVKDNSLEVRRGLTNKSDIINSTALNSDYDSNELEKSALVSFWISKYGNPKRTHFRTLISGLSETVTPSWNSSKFFGNPYSFYSYGGVERSVTFNLFIYCMNATELGINWEKINKLTQYTYPTITTINDSGLSNAPIIEFRIGNIYKNRVGYVESLSYTFPDNGTWETDIDGFQLPKFIDVSISIKLIEQLGAEKKLYSYKGSPQAVAAQNDYDEANGFQLDNVDVIGKKPTRVNKTGEIAALNITAPSPTDINTGLKSITPAQKTNEIPTEVGESAIEDVVPLEDLQNSFDNLSPNILNRG